jgi:hypothetical protein
LSQEQKESKICSLLSELILENLAKAENKIWHRHPVWFLEGNPIVGYSKRKSGIQLMFWSGADFEEEKLKPGSGKFKDSSITYQSADQIIQEDVIRWIKKSRLIQWDYKNIVKRKGKMVKLDIQGD